MSYGWFGSEHFEHSTVSCYTRFLKAKAAVVAVAEMAETMQHS